MLGVILFSGCASDTHQQQVEILADYRASILASSLPIQMAQLTLITVKERQGTVEMIFLDSETGNISTNQIIDKSVITFCNDKEIRPVLEKGVSYRYIVRNSRGQKKNDMLVNEEVCLTRDKAKQQQEKTDEK